MTHILQDSRLVDKPRIELQSKRFIGEIFMTTQRRRMLVRLRLRTLTYYSLSVIIFLQLLLPYPWTSRHEPWIWLANTPETPAGEGLRLWQGAQTSAPAPAPTLMQAWRLAVQTGAVGCRSTAAPGFDLFLPLVATTPHQADGANPPDNRNPTMRSALRIPDQVAQSRLFPPDPTLLATALDTTAPTDLYAATRFLYTGDTPVQIGMQPATIAPERVAVLRGRVLTTDGHPLPGVEIALVNHPEYGCTLSRSDGAYDLVVNGGASFTLRFQLAGHLSAERPVMPSQRDYTVLADVLLLPYDSQATLIDFSEPMQVARGSQMTDADGSRQATLLFPQTARASFVMADGTVRAASSALHIRATEYTVGDRGPAAMPAPLPPASGYTYAAEFSVDEAESAAAVSVEFSEPVISYLENFLHFPVGSPVPAGYYDRQQGRWLAADNGQVIQIIGVHDGRAEVDTDGDGAADNGVALGITDDERTRLAALYPSGQSLWRVPILHFTPWDFNWPFGPPVDAIAPALLQVLDRFRLPLDSEHCTTGCGSVIEVENQILGERLDLVGVPYTLHYASDRTPGRQQRNRLAIPVSGATIPASLQRIEVEIAVAGRRFTQQFPAQPNQTYDFLWDGLDAYGRPVQGAHPVDVRLGYVYTGVYQQPSQFRQAFANFSGTPISGNRTRQEVTLWQEWQGAIGTMNFQDIGLGGWSLSVHHLYDAVGRTLYLGDGTRRSTQGIIVQGINTFAGNGEDCHWASCRGDNGPATAAQIGEPRGIAAGPDGSVYLSYFGRVRQIRPDGTIVTVAGGGNPPDKVGDGLPATQAVLDDADALAIGPDGSLYIAERSFKPRIRRVLPSGIITTVAGTGQIGNSGDGGPATQATFREPSGLAVDVDGALYIADNFYHRVRRVNASGMITTVVGDGRRPDLPGCATGNFQCGDGGPATQAQIPNPGRIALGPDGSLYVTTHNTGRLRRVTPDGIITTAADVARVWQGQGVALAVDGTPYISYYWGTGGRIFRVTPTGGLAVVAGTGNSGFSGDGGPAALATFRTTDDVAVGPDGTVYILDSRNRRIRQVAPLLPGFSGEELPIPSQDGHTLYIFNSQGRHLRTVHTLTGATLYEFVYDNVGLLVQIKDGDGQVTTIERTADGAPTALVGPYGQRTTFVLNGNGLLASVTNPAGESTQFAYTLEGLLTSQTTPHGHITRYEYDAYGRLLRDIDPTGAAQSLATDFAGTATTITHTTPLNRSSRHQVSYPGAGVRRQVDILADGTQVTSTFRSDGSQTIQSVDGMLVTLQEGADPRWSMLAPLVAQGTLKTPAGIASSFTLTRSATLANAQELLSLTTQTEVLRINGRAYRSQYTASERSLLTLSPVGRQRSSRFDPLGRLTYAELIGIAAVTYAYDAQGRLVTVSQGSGDATRTATFTYGDHGYLAQLTDPLGRTMKFVYDAAGRVTQQTLPDDHLIRYSYDANGNLISLTPPGRPAHRFTYNALDRLESYAPPALAGVADVQTHYTYNADQQLTQLARPDGKTITFAYDGAGHLQTLSLARGAYSYAYQSQTGYLSTITAADGGVLRYRYDGVLLTSETWEGAVAGNVAYGYDPDFRLATQTVSGSGAINYQYDHDSLLVGVGALTFTRDPQNGLLTGSTLGGISDSWHYNAFGEPTSYTASANGATFYAVTYARDQMGRITQKSETIQDVTATYAYSYDRSGRLSQVQQNGVLLATYTYDANGNRLSHVGPGGTTTGLYDEQDRLLQYGAASYSYTANGELASQTTNGQTTTYTYDEVGNLMRVQQPDGAQLDYLIDGQNRRIGKRVNGVLVQGFLYEGQLRPVAELDGAGQVVARFVYGNRINVPEYLIKGGVTYRILTDQVGSPRLIVNVADNTIAQRLDYDAFGNVLQDSNPGFQPFGFAGGLYDPMTNLMRFGARDYDAYSGRWTTKDPVLFHGQLLNLYTYALSNPINLKDINGLWAVGIPVVLSAEAGGGATYTPATVVVTSSGEWGLQGSFGLTGGVSMSASAESGVLYSPNAEKLSDLEGGSISLSGKVKALAGATVEASLGTNNIQTYSIRYGVGAGGGVNLGFNDTWTYWKGNLDCIDFRTPEEQAIDAVDPGARQRAAAAYYEFLKGNW